MERLEHIPGDYLNMGYLSLAEGHIKEALNFYKLNIAMRSPASGSSPVEDFLKEMKEERPYLSRLAIDPTLVSLVIDALLYSED